LIDRGIILAGGTGTRLHPLTLGVSKQLLALYDKPMIYYPLSVLMLAGIREILVITTPHEQEMFRRLLGDGGQWGVRLAYEVQPRPEGIAQAFIVGREFIGGRGCALVLGDNVFYGDGLQSLLRRAVGRIPGATVFGYRVKNPEAYGNAVLGPDGRLIDIQEKPARPKSPLAITGLYFFDERVSDFAVELRPSARGELEITDLNRRYLNEGALHLERMGRGYAWLDTGTPETMLYAANFIHAVQSRQGLQVACPEEIALRSGWITRDAVERQAHAMGNTSYGSYLMELVKSDGAS
jgi:glucose-1-phosphate thymidylyltransferase